MKTAKYLILLTIILTGIIIGILVGRKAKSYQGTNVTIADKGIIFAEIADTPQTLQKGLSGRETLGESNGMLFDFTKAGSKHPVFWMKDMRFSIDILWIADGRILYIHENVPPPKSDAAAYELIRYTPPSSIDYVLEVNAGWSRKNNIAVGDRVLISSEANQPQL